MGPRPSLSEPTWLPGPRPALCFRWIGQSSQERKSRSIRNMLSRFLGSRPPRRRNSAVGERRARNLNIFLRFGRLETDQRAAIDAGDRLAIFAQMGNPSGRFRTVGWGQSPRPRIAPVATRSASKAKVALPDPSNGSSSARLKYLRSMVGFNLLTLTCPMVQLPNCRSAISS